MKTTIKNSLLFFLLISVTAQAQNPVRNIKFEKIDGNYSISYDLSEQEANSYFVDILFLKKSNPSFLYKPTLLSGDFGEKVKAGKDKLIVWRFKEEIPGRLKGDDYYFKINAQKIEDGNSLWYYLGAGAGIAVAAVFYLFSGSDSDDDGGGSSAGSIADPPSRP